MLESVPCAAQPRRVFILPLRPHRKAKCLNFVDMGERRLETAEKLRPEINSRPGLSPSFGTQ